jgi:hypothetical protein
MITWSPNWRELRSDDPIRQLSKTDRSLFHDLDEVDILSILVDLGAEISDPTPSSFSIRELISPQRSTKSLPPIFPEGYLLARQRDTLEYLYATLRGSLVFYQHRLRPTPFQIGVAVNQPGREIAEIERLANQKGRLPRLDHMPNVPGASSLDAALPLVTLNYLYYDCACHGVLWPTQVAGLVESGLGGRNPTYGGGPFTRKWLWSLMLSTSSIAVRIPIDNFQALVRSGSRTVVHPRSKDLRLNTYLERRIHEVLALRYSTLVRNLSLQERGEFDRLLGYSLYEYFKGTGKSAIHGTTYKVAFYLGMLENSVSREVGKLMSYQIGGVPALRKDAAKNSPFYTLSPELCYEYYAKAFL